MTSIRRAAVVSPGGLAIKVWNVSAALFAQNGRITAINNAPPFTSEVVALARERLVDGAL